LNHTIRRVVSGHSAQGRSIVLIDELVETIEVAPDQAKVACLWSTEGWPADNNDDRDRSKLFRGTPSTSGSLFNVADFPPGCYFPPHRTLTLDYILVIAGSITLELDKPTTVTLNAGDLLVQRGTLHAWHNKSNDWARVAFVLAAAKPIEIAGHPLKEDFHMPE
jgi:quercetin dioxygenase-like cupin family protein